MLDLTPATVFYDGGCALCHRSVRFVVKRDRRALFRFAPLGGATFRRLLPSADRDDLPDSFVVVTGEGRLLVRSEAALWVGGRLDAPWPLLAAAGRLLPRSWADRLYDAVARRRTRWFGTETESCPIVPPALRERFED
jgi:predicted DCC family thiol-disulfide oxidoreductase YuxK